MKLIRIADKRHPIWDGTGAGLIGGRWNSPGRPAIYAAQSYSCAMLELLVHSNTGRVPLTQQAVTVEVPDNIATTRLNLQDCPPGWDGQSCAVARAIGDHWLQEQSTVILLVPSAVVNMEWNAVVNPAHRDFSSLVVSMPVPVVWDHRLFQRSN